jgi:hypothetical protein
MWNLPARSVIEAEQGAVKFAKHRHVDQVRLTAERPNRFCTRERLTTVVDRSPDAPAIQRAIQNARVGEQYVIFRDEQAVEPSQ